MTAWGKLIATTGSLANTVGANQPFRYRGYVYDEETGWYYLQSRFYDPETCRFISAVGAAAAIYYGGSAAIAALAALLSGSAALMPA